MWLNESILNMNTDEYKLSEREFLLAKDYIQGNLFMMKNAFSENIDILKWYILDRPFYFNWHQWFLALKCLIELKENWITNLDLDEIEWLSSIRTDNIWKIIEEQNSKIDELKKEEKIQKENDLGKASLLSERIKKMKNLVNF